jgi:hypothetical protein
MEWTKVYYNGLETNIEVTKCSKVRRVRKDWEKLKTKTGEVDYLKRKTHKNGYLAITIKIKDNNSRACQIQQLIAAAFLGYKWNGHKLVVDHIDSNPLNNNLYNLRIITQRENSSKERTLKSGLPVGVNWNKLKNKYQTRIVINKKRYHLGYYNTIEEASQAYINKLIKNNK